MGLSHIHLQIILCPFITWVNPFGMPYTNISFTITNDFHNMYIHLYMLTKFLGFPSPLSEDSSPRKPHAGAPCAWKIPQGWHHWKLGMDIVDKVWLTGLPTMEYPMIYPFLSNRTVDGGYLNIQSNIV